MLILYYTTTTADKLPYAQFLQLILPCEDLALRQKTQDSIATTSSKAMASLAQLLVKELRFHQTYDFLRKKLVRQYDYSLPAVFTAVDDWAYGFWDQQGLKRFMKKAGFKQVT